MKTVRALAYLSLVSVMSACVPSGYYDSNGNYRAYGSSDSYRHENNMAGTPTTPYSSAAAGSTTIIYTRPGYYDREGDYITGDSAPRVPQQFFPPRGMCRMWFAGRPADEQPAIESCDGIRSRVPQGAYVIYGG